MKKLSKTEANNEIKEFFRNIEDKSSRDVKKIKKLAMSYNLPLKDFRKKFCKECFTPYTGKEKIRIKNKMKIIGCKNCDNITRWRIKN